MVKRVITSTNKNGKSYISDASIADNVEVPFADIDPDLKFHNLWVTNKMPVEVNLQEEEDATKNTYVSTSPQKNGSMFRIVDYPPESKLINTLKNFSDNELKDFEKRIGVKLDYNANHPLMHMTKSIDFAIVLSGEIYLVLDEEEIFLKAGDVVIQRGTNHAWSNRSDKICKMAYVLLDANLNK
ncbi:cupin domain-containing protein [Francisella sp. SYW-9]|uniref:cupin domain-containing protein n=1 Tax=Francisella sp. SYW-9 TaxID=2610888 RepID=UPI00123DED4D|nr:cupin domain-containing protein [Francisella sp. SYW-9]